MRQIVRLPSQGLIHDDLSEFSVLLAPDGPVIIDLQRVVNASGNNAARAMLERGVDNIRNALGRFAPELPLTAFAGEMWTLYEQGELCADSVLTRAFLREESPPDPHSLVQVIEDAREEANRLHIGREEKVG